MSFPSYDPDRKTNYQQPNQIILSYLCSPHAPGKDALNLMKTYTKWHKEVIDFHPILQVMKRVSDKQKLLSDTCSFNTTNKWEWTYSGDVKALIRKGICSEFVTQVQKELIDISKKSLITKFETDERFQKRVKQEPKPTPNLTLINPLYKACLATLQLKELLTSLIDLDKQLITDQETKPLWSKVDKQIINLDISMTSRVFHILEANEKIWMFVLLPILLNYDQLTPLICNVIYQYLENHNDWLRELESKNSNLKFHEIDFSDDSTSLEFILETMTSVFKKYNSVAKRQTLLTTDPYMIIAYLIDRETENFNCLDFLFTNKLIVEKLTDNFLKNLYGETPLHDLIYERNMDVDDLCEHLKKNRNEFLIKNK